MKIKYIDNNKKEEKRAVFIIDEDDVASWCNIENPSDELIEFIHEEFFVVGLEKFQFVKDGNFLIIKAVISGNEKELVKSIREMMNEILIKNGLEKDVKFEVKVVDEILNDPKTGKFKLIIPNL